MTEYGYLFNDPGHQFVIAGRDGHPQRRLQEQPVASTEGDGGFGIVGIDVGFLYRRFE
eukprot:CAMPEP_0194385030 /NCGR_PEP_ID=MMETSP0174-20130528/77720_1 /TAXON_ID=216777 /ORGANISM="Proboscia alata, Strain PI-D3" /LENGTH=57 /DNA_ID=CAMNT_0039172769 /DNA_START=20 /DNA_END=190 /DNA_ORIENTATION=-